MPREINPIVDMDMILDDLKSALIPNNKKNIVMSDDENYSNENNNDFMKNDMSDSAPPSLENEEDLSVNEDNLEDENNLFNTQEDEEEPKKFDRDVVISILQVLRTNGYVDASFDSKNGFKWSYSPAHSYLTLKFDDKFNERKSFSIEMTNKLEISEEALKDSAVVESLIDSFKQEYDLCSKILLQLKQIYNIVY
jgi:hypothetical protein